MSKLTPAGEIEASVMAQELLLAQQQKGTVILAIKDNFAIGDRLARQVVDGAIDVLAKPPTHNAVERYTLMQKMMLDLYRRSVESGRYSTAAKIQDSLGRLWRVDEIHPDELVETKREDEEFQDMSVEQLMAIANGEPIAALPAPAKEESRDPLDELQ